MAEVDAQRPGLAWGGGLRRFSKMHGAGNDFVMLDLRGSDAEPSAQLCRDMADRQTGVGCDQIITIHDPRSAGAVAAYRIWNADGSASGQCGNGARCVAAWLVRAGAVTGPRFVLDSPARSHEVLDCGDGVFEVAMGAPVFAPDAVPMQGIAAAQDEYALSLDGGEPVRFGAVSMGNPHAVIEVGSVAVAPVARIGPLLQAAPCFPESVNVGFAQVVDRGHVRLRVYERGVGETLACGSGACAAAVVLMQRGRVDREVEVSLPGGELLIRWPGEGAQVSMRGPTAFVFEGEWIA